MTDALHVMARARTFGPPRLLAGGLSGLVTVVAFAVVHDLLIVDIWSNIGSMVFAGIVCGLCLVWSYNAAVEGHSPRRWFAFNGVCAVLLVALGAVSLLVLDPRFSIVELMGNDDALGLVLPPALPLMAAAAVVNTGLLWAWSDRRRAALVPLLVTQVLLVFFVGHQLAILGVVEMSSRMVVAFAEFAALTLFLAGVFALGVGLIQSAWPARVGRRS